MEADVSTINDELAKTGVDIARLQIRTRQVQQHTTRRPSTYDRHISINQSINQSFLLAIYTVEKTVIVQISHVSIVYCL